MPSVTSRLGLCRGEQPSNWRREAYIESYNGEQMFDLYRDKDEQNNVVCDPEYAPARQELRDRLPELVAMQDYPMPRRDLFALGVH